MELTEDELRYLLKSVEYDRDCAQLEVDLKWPRDNDPALNPVKEKVAVLTRICAKLECMLFTAGKKAEIMGTRQ